MTEHPGNRTVKFGPDTLEITDPEIVTEVRLMNGVFAVSLASAIVDGSGPPEARICVRLRFTPEVGAMLQTMMSEMLANAAQAKQAAN